MVTPTIVSISQAVIWSAGSGLVQLPNPGDQATSARGVVVISVGAESSKVAERYARHAESVGADAVMAIPPVSVGIGEGELLAYYRRIIEAIRIPVILQDASGYVGKPMPIAMQARLLDEFGPERVLYKPEASPIGPKLSELRDATGGRARVFEGTGGIAHGDPDHPAATRQAAHEVATDETAAADNRHSPPRNRHSRPLPGQPRCRIKVGEPAQPRK